MNRPAPQQRRAFGRVDTPIPGDDLVAAILRRAPRFNFFQFCQLLEAARPDHPPLGVPDTPTHDPVRFLSQPSLGFPGTELSRVEVDPDRPDLPPSVRTTFLGLYGVDARMPWYVLDGIATRCDGHESLMAFLDLFSHRTATLFYRVWRKYRYPVGFEPGARDRISQSLLCLVGLGIGDIHGRHGLPAANFLALLGLGGQRTRTAEGLAAVVRHIVPGAHVTVEERHPVIRRLDTPAQLGREPVPLRSGSLVLGRTLRERNSTVRIVIEPRPSSDAGELLPGGQDHADLLKMLRVYLGYRFDAELVLRIDPSRLPPTTLGGWPARIGLTAMAGKAAAGRPIDIRLGRYCGLSPEHAPDAAWMNAA